VNSLPILTLLTLLPLFGGVVLLGLDRSQQRLARGLAVTFSLLTLALTVALWLSFNTDAAGLQFVEKHAWIPSLGIEYKLGLDGLSLLLVALTALVTPMAMLAARGIYDRAPLFFALVLFLEAGLMGTFTAMNFFHWFLFYELALVPAFFLVKLWGGPQRGPAATQFFIYTMVGSVAMLLAFLALFQATRTFDFLELAALARSGKLVPLIGEKLAWAGLGGPQLALVLFGGVLLGFAVKVPLMPFHTWLPAAYAEAPSSVTMLLTGVMSKMGVYGLLRILLPIFPEPMRAVLTPLLWLAVATIVFSAFAAFAQRDLKRVLAYSSINHLGYCLLGCFVVVKADGAALERAAALSGVLLQMFSHGLTAAALFCFLGFLEERSGGLRGLDDFGGLRRVVPVFCGLMGISLFASLGLPGLSGFVGEFLIFKGAFALSGWSAAVSTLGLLVTAIFLLTLLQRVFNGPLNERWKTLPDLTAAERLVVVPAVLLMFALGIYPQLITAFTSATVSRLVEQLKF
jgi:NADH-quinone oxidoreductase subunit M